jgi:hypothetical protein
MTNISKIAKETQIRHMEKAHHPKMQNDICQDGYPTMVCTSSKNMYIHQSKTLYDTYDTKEKPKRIN